MGDPTAIANMEKRQALSRILASHTFSRCEQLKSFLRYVAEAEMAGRGPELTEYQVAVQALGRRADFTPTEDASVRNRAHLLRRRLETYYAEENPVDRLRIELPKGSYCPVFREVSTSMVAFGSIQPSANNHAAELPAVLREAWGPLVAPSGNPLICIATPAHLMLRPDATRLPEGEPEMQAGDLLPWYRGFPSLPSTQQLFLRPSPTSLLWGDCVGALVVNRLMTLAAVVPEVLPELAISIAALRNRNVILFGRADYSRAVELLTKGAPFQVKFRSAIQESAVVNLRPRHGEPAAYEPQFAPDNRSETVYGLITVIPSMSRNPGQQRTVILSGTISPGAQAAAEFFCSAKNLAEFKQLLARDGSDRFPEAYQVVVKAHVHRTMALDVCYVTHRVLDPAAK